MLTLQRRVFTACCVPLTSHRPTTYRLHVPTSSSLLGTPDTPITIAGGSVPAFNIHLHRYGNEKRASLLMLAVRQLSTKLYIGSWPLQALCSPILPIAT